MIPLVSIIVLTYNQEQYISKCLDSIINQQTSFPFQVIVSDDASSDQTSSIITTYKNKFPDIVIININLQNQGIVANYLMALSSCTGKYICLLGGDDFWIDKNKIQSQVDFLEMNTDFGMAYTNYKIVDENSLILVNDALTHIGKTPIEGDGRLKLIEGDSQIMPLTVCIRRSILSSEYVKFMNDEFFLAEDYPTWFWISFHSKIHYMNIITSSYRIHSKSYTNSQTKEQKWKFARSSRYMRIKLMNTLGYKPGSLEPLDIKLHRGILRLSLKTGFGKAYAIASYKILKKLKGNNLEDSLMLIGLHCGFLAYFARISIYTLKSLKVIKR
jgi:glycosyltransferase involved in cell wall biosynthesis